MMTPRELADTLESRLHGPHADEHTAATAHLAAEAVRYLNYATGPDHGAQGLEFPGTAYSTAWGLSAAAQRMPQLFEQLAAALFKQYADGLLATDDGGPVAEVIAAAELRLEEAAKLASRLGYELASLQTALSGLNGRGPNRQTGDDQ